LDVAQTPDDGFSKVNLGSERTLTQLHEPTAGSTSLDVLADEFVSLSVAGIGGFVEQLSRTTLLEDLEAAPPPSISSSGASSYSRTMDDNTAADRSDPGDEIAMYRFVDWMVKLLVDDFFRSHVPNGPNRRAVGASQKDVKHASDDQTRESSDVNKGSRPEPVSRKRKALGGDGSSEDEGSERKKQKPSGAVEAKDRWACPFAQREPQKYQNCVVGVSTTIKKGPATIGGLKNHIKKIHVMEYCNTCWSQYTTSQEAVKHQLCSKIYARSDPPPGLLTKERYVEIFETEVKGQSPEEQWDRIYSVLYPGEQRCSNRHVNKEAYKDLCKAEMYLRSKKTREIINQEILEAGYSKDHQKQALELVYSVFARIIQKYDPSDKDTFTPARNEPQAIETIQSSQIDVTGTDRASTEFERLHHASPPSPGEASISHQFPESNPAEVFMPDQQPPAGESILGIDTPSAWLDLPELEGFLGSVELGDSEGHFMEISDRPLEENFENNFYDRLEMDEDYPEILPDAHYWDGNNLLSEQA
jgi:hypothetical protein